MHIHVIEHVPFEGPGTIAEWALERGHSMTRGLALADAFPPLFATDMLVVMGGPMGALDDDKHPWLTAEKRFVASAVEAGHLVLGVCLGAQIIADVIGARVHRNHEREIGWYPVRLTEHGAVDPVFAGFPEALVVGHWHGDTFDLPDSMLSALSSEACANQAFSALGGRIVGLQFHLEWTQDSVHTMTLECADELDGGRYVMTAPDILEAAPDYLGPCRDALFSLLDAMVKAKETA